MLRRVNLKRSELLILLELGERQFIGDRGDADRRAIVLRKGSGMSIVRQ